MNQWILLPIDSLEESTRALRFGAQLAETCGAGLCIFYVGDEAPFPEGHGLHSILVERIVGWSLETFRGRSLSSSKAPPMRFETRCGASMSEILSFARDEEMDMMLLPPLAGLSARSVSGAMNSEQVAAAAPCPVIPLGREWLDRHSQRGFRQVVPWIDSAWSRGAREGRKLEW